MVSSSAAKECFLTYNYSQRNLLIAAIPRPLNPRTRLLPSFPASTQPLTQTWATASTLCPS